jgi:hypothetical protein
VQPERRPAITLDVDGVLFPWLKPEYGQWLLSLAGRAELVWASAGWGESANWHIGPHIGLPELPVIDFPCLVKLPEIREWCGTRPLAWVDDWFAPEARSWAAARRSPTLLVDVDEKQGLQRAHCEAISAWLDGLGPAGA